MSFLADFFKSLNIGGPTYFDKKDQNKALSPDNQVLTPPKEGLLGALGVGQVEKKIGPLEFQAVNVVNPTTTEEIKRFNTYKRNQETRDAQRMQREEQEKQSLVKTAQNEEATEKEATIPTPPPPPKTGPSNNEESTSSTEGTDETKTELSDEATVTTAKKKLKSGSLIKQAGLLTDDEKKKLGLLA